MCFENSSSVKRDGDLTRAAVLLLVFFLGQIGASAQDQAIIQDVSFEAEVDGSVQHYVQILPKEFNPSEQHHLLIALHGHGSDRWQFATGDIDQARAARDVAEEHDMIYVSPDYRASTSWMGPKAERDVVQIISRVKKQFSIDRVLVSGASMGGSSSLTFAVLHPELVDGVVSINGTANHLEYENFQGAIRESFGGTKQEIPMEYKNRSAEYFPERLTMPIAITAGGPDETVPPDSVLRLAKIVEKLNPDTLLLYRPEGGHSTNYEDSRQAYEFVVDKMSR
ncbi:MAG: alpha/beta fold hydrolase [Candidatus Omnitrophica bacterium]|nr:alpha/beta fold hydrolase [Candidatus Omnitrophota bacterium]